MIVGVSVDCRADDVFGYLEPPRDTLLGTLAY
jgi:hypothetical protein